MTWEEVWLCGLEGEMTFFTAEAEVKQSKLFPEFPSAI